MLLSSFSAMWFINSLTWNLNIFCGGWKITKFFLSILSESLLQESHDCIWHKWSFTMDSSSLRFLWAINKLESSANRWNSKTFDQFIKSLMYKRNNKGPSTEPCGTPQCIKCSAECKLSIETNCLLLLKYETQEDCWIFVSQLRRSNSALRKLGVQQCARN